LTPAAFDDNLAFGTTHANRGKRMTEERDPNEDAVEDLDVNEDEADAVKGGRRADPCEGGE
jgi:hypothetical protein